MSQPKGAALARYRSVFVKAFPDTAQVQRTRKIKDDAGGRTNEPPVVAAPLPCRVQASRTNAAEGAQQGGLRATGEIEILLPWDADVRNTDRIKLASTGESFEVIGTDKGKSEALCLTAQVKRIT